MYKVLQRENVGQDTTKCSSVGCLWTGCSQCWLGDLMRSWGCCNPCCDGVMAHGGVCRVINWVLEAVHGMQMSGV